MAPAQTKTIQAKCRVAIFDLDGTLLDSHKRVPDANAAAVRKLIAAQDTLVVFATARPPRATYPLINGLADSTHLICYNGAVCLHRREHISATLIPETAVRTIIARVTESFPGLACGLEHDDELWSVGNFDRHFPRDYKANLQPSELPRRPAPKVLVDIPTPAHISKVRALLPEDCGSVLTDKEGLLQVMAKGVSKRSAVEQLLRAHGIEWSEAVCFGDDLNDLELFQACGTSVAMANAHPTLKAAATHHTCTNDEAGVAVALAKLGLAQD